MGGPTEHLGLQLDADAKAWDSSFQQAERSAGKLGGKIDEAARRLAEAEKKAGTFGGALSDAASKGTGKFGELLKKQQDAAKSFDDLINRSESAAKKQEGLWDKVTKKVIEAEVVIGGLKMAWQAVGDYMAGAFERAKLDPALAGINQMREATEEWTRTWQGAVDRVLNSIAEGMYGDPTRTRAGAARESARTSAIEDLRQRGFPVNAPGFENSAEFRDTYQRYLGGYQQRAFGSANAQALAAGLTSAAIARDRGVAAWGRPLEGLAGAASGWIGDRYGGIQGQALLGGIGRLWGDAPARRRGGGRRDSHIFRGLGVLGSDIGASLDWAGQQAARNYGDFWGESNDGGDALGRLLERTGDSLAGVGRDFKGGFGSFWNGTDAEKTPGKLSQIEQSLQGVGDAVATTIAGAVSAGEAGARAIFRMGAAQMKTTAITEGVLALANFWNPSGAQHAAAAAAALAGMAALGALGGGIGGGGAPTGGGYGGGAGSVPGGGYASARPSQQQQGGNTYVINVTGYTSRAEAAVAVAQGIREAEQAGRVRNPSTRVTRYGASR